MTIANPLNALPPREVSFTQSSCCERGGEGTLSEDHSMTSYIRFDVKPLLEMYWKLWLAPGIDFDYIEARRRYQ